MTKLQYRHHIFEHNPRKIKLHFLNTVAAQALPGYGEITQNLGPRCRVVRCEGEVFAQSAAGAMAKLAEIAQVCKNDGTGMLYLPTGEQFEASVSRFSYIAQGDGRVMTYQLEFIERKSRAEGV